MAKRIATSELTHENWDQEEEVVEAGHFVTASEDKLKNRVFKKAKRKNPLLNESSSNSPSPFSGFSGFSTSSTPAFSGFSFSANSKSDANDKVTESKSTSISGFTFTSNSNSDNKLAPELPINAISSNKGLGTKNNEDEESYSSEYYESLKCLNKAFLSWLEKHMAESSYCIFNPVFKDYETHLMELEKKYKIGKSHKTSKTESVSSTNSTGFSFNSSIKSPNTEIVAKPSNTPIALSFPTTDLKSVTPTSKFTFGTAAMTPASSNPSNNTKEEVYKPPENEFNEVKEDDAFFTKKCKLFFKKDGDFVEKGKGNIFLKKVDGKTQLLVRADTNLGNVLLNIVLNKSMPASRIGKNNVMIICIPNPPVDTKSDTQQPIPMLIRVKTGDDADKLLKVIDENKE